MTKTASEIMTPDPYTVAPDTGLDAVEMQLTRRRISAAPVVDQGRLVGLISRADILRKIGFEQCLSDVVIDYYRQLEGVLKGSQASPQAQHLAEHALGKQLRQLRVSDAMSTNVQTASPETSVSQIAKTMLEQRLHQVVIADESIPVGIVSTLDVLRLLANTASSPDAG